MTALWPHQQAAVDKLAPIGRGMLAMDVGTGKSLTALELIRRWDCRRVLIVCPKSMVAVWPREIAKHGFADWRILPLLQGTTTKRAESLRTAHLCAQVDGQPLAAVVNYEATIHGEFPSTLMGIPWDCLLLDECQKAKSYDSKTSKLMADLSRRIPHVLGLTGTLLHNTPLDAFGQFRSVSPDVFGTDYWAFFNRYAHTQEQDLRDQLEELGQRELRRLLSVRQVTDPDGFAARHGHRILKRIQARAWPPRPDEYDAVARELGEAYVRWRVRKAPWLRSQVLNYRYLEEFSARIEPVTYRCTKRDVLTLPPVVHQDRLCILGSKTRSAYESMRKDLVAKVDAGEIRAANALSAGIRLAQIANGFSVDPDGNVVEIGTEKRELLQEILDEIPADEPVVVFGVFHHDLDVTYAAAQATGRTCCELSGRRNDLEAWQAGEYNVLAAQVRAGGAGVSFVRACYQVYLAHPWSPGDYEQTLGRIDRPGQTRPVTYLHLMAAETIDERVVQALQSKRDLAETVMTGIKGE